MLDFSQNSLLEMGYFPKTSFRVFPKTFLGFPNSNYFREEFGKPVKSMLFGTLNLGKSPKRFPKTVILKTTILCGNSTHPLIG